MTLGFKGKTKLPQRPLSNPFKKYVDVICKHTIDGKIIPMLIIWNQCETFEIDKILDISNAASFKAGGMGIRYKCKICDKETFLFYDTYEEKWFVEAKTT